jgi:NAD(P)H-hydrate epimerase
MPSSPTTIDAKLAISLLPKRESGAHKWSVGGVLVIAGSPLYPGAAWLASRAAGRAGAGIVLLASGRGVVSSIAGSLPEVAHVILPESDTQSGAKRTLELIGEKLDRVKSVVVGPGLGDDEATSALLGTIFGLGRAPLVTRENIGFGQRANPLSGSSESSKKTGNTPQQGAIFGDGSIPVVIDADGLNWLAKQTEWWTHVPSGSVVLTPHVGELSRLLDIESDEILKNPQKHAEKAASSWNQVVVLKTGQTIATDGKRTLIAERETPALATAGSGDVFAGTIGALLAQGLAPLDAATLAIYLGTRAATELTAEFGESGVIATDLPDAIARATRTLAS